MAFMTITASISRAQSYNHGLPKRQSSRSSPVRPSSCLGTKNDCHVTVPSNNLDVQDHLNISRKEQQINPFQVNQVSNQAKEEVHQLAEAQLSLPKFSDERWKDGTWDLNLFVKRGKMDWDAVIVAEARRRRFLELHPEAATNQEAVLFRSSVIPWWAWISHSHLPEAELLNGRAAMVGFFMAYFVDALTRLDVVGQTGNFICKAALLVTVVGILLFRKTQDFENLQKLAEEATFYDRQWRQHHQDSATKQNRI